MEDGECSTTNYAATRSRVWLAQRKTKGGARHALSFPGSCPICRPTNNAKVSYIPTSLDVVFLELYPCGSPTNPPMGPCVPVSPPSCKVKIWFIHRFQYKPLPPLNDPRCKRLTQPLERMRMREVELFPLGELAPSGDGPLEDLAEEFHTFRVRDMEERATAQEKAVKEDEHQVRVAVAVRVVGSADVDSCTADMGAKVVEFHYSRFLLVR